VVAVCYSLVGRGFLYKFPKPFTEILQQSVAVGYLVIFVL
jgi:hypothetical protein